MKIVCVESGVIVREESNFGVREVEKMFCGGMHEVGWSAEATYLIDDDGAEPSEGCGVEHGEEGPSPVS